MRNICFWSLSMCGKKYFEIVLGSKCDTVVFTFFFSFSLLHSSFAFLVSSHNFSFIFLGIYFCRMVFGKAFAILGLDDRKGRWAVEQDFHENFRINVTCFSLHFFWPPWLNHTHSGMVWKISTSCTSKPTKLSLNVKTDDIISGRRDVDPHRRFRGEKVSTNY